VIKKPTSSGRYVFLTHEDILRIGDSVAFGVPFPKNIFELSHS
jgi:hypothetical protein